ncbi:PAXNEB-domain-containing protein [Laetiporus sulphureus 93-53]|uniref:Elongator complex protein 4 n=1 Tax=Laetiporus sulphureus 93-53 TaxID=1314785 RepID=A0A165DZ24_9APHY|nr:PAXNEB-domain-containing protein [Laetiporus sulphureus 93-53]KZT05926.1 PAXNEB-domain-containing protein [Laetiporus sulphureus 93-53]
MSSFKRKTTSKQQSLQPGTRISPGSTSTIITSTGIPSLDDILGGGLPLSCSQLVLAPDPHSAYGELVQKYFIAQGLATSHRICIVDDDARDFLSECVWIPGQATHSPSHAADDEEDEKAGEDDAKIKIAWRYEQMKQFQTTVSDSNQSTEDYCRTFDLTCRIPDTVLQSSVASGQVILVPVSAEAEDQPSVRILDAVEQILVDHAKSSESPAPIRICIPSLGSWQWGDISPRDISYFLYSLRSILRRHPFACASVSLPPPLCTETWGGAGWVQKLGWLTDASITLAAFTASPSLTAMFSAHHGFVHIHSLPAPHTLVPPSDRFSTLRGLSSSGENNLAFKCMRKRLIFETLHLDLEGGVGERRTTPAPNAMAFDEVVTNAHPQVGQTANALEASAGGNATVQVEVEQMEVAASSMSVADDRGEEKVGTVKKVKTKKKVAFMSDRPDLYDF